MHPFVRLTVDSILRDCSPRFLILQVLHLKLPSQPGSEIEILFLSAPLFALI